MGRLRLTRLIGAAMLLTSLAFSAAGQDRRLTIGVPEALIETGFLKHLLPRFSLKHGVPITLVAPAAPADAALTDGPQEDSVAVFAGANTTWHLLPLPGAKTPHLQKLSDWLTSDIGRKAILGFKGAPPFTPPVVDAVAVVAAPMPGDAGTGLGLSLRHCGRCHVVGPQNRMAGIGNTPSFRVLRTFGDWEDRFGAFYALKPHPSFTRVEDLSPPFPDGTQPTIEPVTLTIEELEDITAYAASLDPADLGAPIKHQ